MNFKKVISVVISISLVACLTPSIVFAEKEDIAPASDSITEPVVEPTAEQGERDSENLSVEELQSRIDALPSVEEFQVLDKEKQDDIYQEIQNIADVCDKLPADDQEKLDMSKVIALSEFINGQTKETEQGSYSNVSISGSDITIKSTTGSIDSIVINFYYDELNSINGAAVLYTGISGVIPNFNTNLYKERTLEAATNLILTDYKESSLISDLDRTIVEEFNRTSNNNATMYLKENAVNLANDIKLSIYTFEKRSSTSYIGDAYLGQIWINDGVVSFMSKDSSSWTQVKNFHSHSWSYSASGDKVVAKCTQTQYSTGCSYQAAESGGTLQLDAQNSPYTGSAYNKASITSNTITGRTGASAGSITYVGRGSTSYSSSTTAPTNVGTYTARVTIGGATASKDFEITPLSINPTVSLSDWNYGDTPATPSVTGNLGNGVVTYQYKTKDSTDEFQDITDFSTIPAGAYTLRANIAATTNYLSGSATCDFSVLTRDISPTVEIVGWTYDGQDNCNPTTSGNPGGGVVTYKYYSDSACTTEVSEVKNAGTYYVKAFVAAVGSYNAGVSPAKEFTVSPKEVMLVWSNISLTYNKSAQKPSATFKDGALVRDDECNITVSGEKTDVGSNYEATATIDNNNYTLSNATCTFEITPKEISATITSTGGTYAGTITPATATLSDSLTADEAGLTLTYKGSTNAGVAYDSTTAPDQAGTYKVFATITNGNYTLPETSSDFNVERTEAGLSVGDSKSATFGDADFNLSATTNSEATLSYTSKDLSKVTVDVSGNVHIVGAGSTGIEVTSPETANYKSDKKTVTIEVAKADPVVTAPVGKKNLEYTGQALELVVAGSTTGGELQYKVGNGSWSADIPTGTEAATYTVYYKVVGDNNYNDVAEASLTVKISLSVITVTEHAYTGTYDGAEHESNVTADVEGAKIEYKKQGESDFSEESPKYKLAGSYTVDYRVSKDNYETVEGQFTVTISKQTVKVTGIVAEDKTYDGNTSATLNFDSVVFDGKVASDTLTASANGTFDSADAGERDVAITDLSIAGVDVDNYELDTANSQKTATATINPKEISATITSDGGTYAGTITPATATLSDGLTEDEAGLTLTYKGNTNAGVAYDSTTAPDQAGTYKVFATITNGNYALPETSADFNIERAEAGLSVDAIPEKHYLDADFDLSTSHEGDGALTYKSSETSVATISATGTVSIKGVGTTLFTINLAETPNYKSAVAEIEMTVKKVPHTINIQSESVNKTYGDASFNLGVTADDSESDIKYQSNDSTVASVDENGNVSIHKAGETEIVISMEDSDNYSASTKTITITVSPKPITVKAKDSSKKYNTDDPTFEYEVLNSGLVESDTLTGIQLSREAGENYKKSGYVISVTAEKDANPNYDITFEAGTFTITQIDLATATVSLGKALRYTGEELTQNVSKVTVENIDVPDASYVVSNNSGTDAGIYKLKIDAVEDSNFSGSVEWTYVIAPKVIETEEGVLELGNGKISFVRDSDKSDITAEFVNGFSDVVDSLLDGKTISADELSAVAEGAEMQIVWTVKDNSSSIDEDSKTELVKEAGNKGYEIGRFIDLALSKVVNIDGETFEEAITETSDEISIELSVPENLINKDTENINRKYEVFRNHNSTVDLLGAAFQEDDKTLIFSTNKFSDYALAYADTVIPHEVVVDPVTPSEVNPEGVKTASPITSDSLRATLVVLIFMLVCVVSAAFISCRNRKNSRIIGLHYRR